MTMKKTIITAMALMFASLGSYAQGWQTGGGYDSSQSLYGQSDDIDFGEFSRPNFVSLFSGEHRDAPVTFGIGYVNKYWSTDFGDYTWRENFWGERNKRLHGLQLGVNYQPCLPMGLGVHTGLFYEAYFSVSDAVKEMGWDNFTEHNLYLPLHGMFRVPFSRHSSLSVYGGLGFNWAFIGEYSEDDEYVCDIFDNYYHYGDHGYQRYGRGEWPHRFNVSTELGATLRFNEAVGLSFTYSHGLTNHEFYHKEGNFKTVQNKLSISLSVTMPDDF